MKWIDAKMQELGVSGNTAYKLCLMMDDLAMITVDTPTYGVIEVFWHLLVGLQHILRSEAKALEARL